MSNPLDDYLSKKREAADETASLSFDALNEKVQAHHEHSRMVKLNEIKRQEQETARRDKTLKLLKKAGRDRSVGEVLKDTALGLGAKGALAIGETAYGVADLVSRFSPVTLDEFTGDISDDGQAMSQRFAETREILNENQSDKLQAQRELIQGRAARRQAENEANRNPDDTIVDKAGQVLSDFGSAVGDYIDNPSAAIDTTLESLPQMLVPGAITKQFTKQHIKNTGKKTLKDQTEKGAGNLAKFNADKMTKKYLNSKEGKAYIEKIAERSGVGFTVAAEGVSNGIQVQAEILNADHASLLESSPAYKELIDNGVSAKDAKRKLADKASLVTTGLAGLFGGVTSKLSGAGKLEGKLFKIDSPIGRNIVTKTSKAAAVEGVEETVQEGAGQFASNVGKKVTVNPDQDLSEGVVDSAAAGLVAGVTSGGGLAAVANTPQALKTGAGTIKKGTEKVAEKAGEKTGRTPEVREAIKTGDDSKVMKPSDKGGFEKPIEAVTYLQAQDLPEDPQERQKHILKMRLAIASGLKQEGLPEKQAKLLMKKMSEVNALAQFERQEQKEDTDALMKTAAQGALKSTPENVEKVNRTVNVLGNSDLSSPGSAKQVIKNAETLLKTGVASIEDTERLKTIVANAKQVTEVTKDIFSGNNGKFVGIDTYNKAINTALEAGDLKLAATNLQSLQKFRDSHVTKAANLQRAFAAQQKVTGDITRNDLSKADQDAIKLAEQRDTLTGSKFKVHNGSGGLVKTIAQEAKALEQVTAQMESLVGNSAPESTTKVDTPIDTDNGSETTTEAPATVSTGEGLLQQAKDAKLKIPAAVRKDPNHKASIRRLKAMLKDSAPLGASNDAGPDASPQPVEATGKPKSVVGLKEQVAKATSAIDRSTVAGRKEYRQKRNDLYVKAYNQVAKKAQKAGVFLNSKVVNKIQKQKFTQPDYVENAINNLDSVLRRIDQNKDLGNEFTELTKEADRLGIFVKPDDIETVNNQDPNDLNAVPKVVKALRTKIEKVGKEYDVRKNLFDKEVMKAFTWDRSSERNILQDSANAFEQIRDLLNDNTLSEEQRKSVKSIIKFHDEFVDNLTKNMDAKPEHVAYKDPIAYFIREQGYDPKDIGKESFDPNVLTAMAMVSMNWLATKGNNTLMNDRRAINSMLHRDTKMIPTRFENDLLQYTGTNYGVAARQDLGPNILRALGIKAKDDTLGDEAQGLANSLTNHAMGTMMRMNLVTRTDVPTFAIKALIDGKSERDILDLAEKNKSREMTPFVRIVADVETRNGVKVPVPASVPGEYIEAVRNSEKLLETMFAIKSNENKPVFEKPKGTADDVVSEVRNSSQKVSGKIKEKLAKEQSYAYGLNAPMVELTDYLGADNDLAVAGLDTEYLENAHETEHKNIEGKNATLVRDYENFQNFRTEMPSADSAFYFTKQVWKSHRMGFDSNTVNPQASHYHRNMVTMQDHVVEIDPTNKQEVAKLLRAVGASIGIKTEKMTTEQTNAAVLSKLNEPVFAAGIDALRNRKTNSTPENKQAIVDAAIEGGEAHWSLNGLSAYADYLDAKDTGTKFKSYLYREPDGITNGIAISLMQFVNSNMDKMFERLARVGIYRSPQGSYSTYSNELGSNDAYEATASSWNAQINNIKSVLKGEATQVTDTVEEGLNKFYASIGSRNPLGVFNSLQSLVGSFTEEQNDAISSAGRKLAKNPLMTNNYGAAIAKITEIFAKDRLRNVYKTIAENKDDREFVRNIVRNLSRVIGTRLDEQAATENPLKWKLTNEQTSLFNDMVDSIYGGTVEKAIQDEYGDMIDKRKTINKAMNLAYSAFKLQYDEKHEALEKENEGRLPSKAQLKKLNKELLTAMPIFRGVFSVDRESGLMVMKRNFTSDRTNSRSRLQSTFTQKGSVDVGIVDVRKPAETKKGKPQKSLTLHAQKESWDDGGVAGPITAIHNIDSATMLATLEEHAAVNVHDAFIGNVLNSDSVAQSINQNFYQINKEHSVVTELYKAFHNSMNNLVKNDRAAYNKLMKEGKNFELAKEFQSMAVSNAKNRIELFKQIGAVDQYTDGPGTAYEVGSEFKELTKENLEQYVKDAQKAINALGSDADSDFINDFNATLELEITNKNSKEIYEDLGVDDPVKDSREHDKRLRGLLDQIVNKVIEPTKLHIQEKGDTNVGAMNLDNGEIYLSNAMPSQVASFSTRMSQRETYVHELLHAVTHTMIDGNSTAARQLRKLYTEIRDAKDAKGNPWLTAKDFLDPKVQKGDAAYTEELRLAQDRYDYVFGNKVGRRTGKVLNPVTEQFEEKQFHNAHHEFLVMGVTNDAFIKKLAKYDAEVKSTKTEGGSWIDRFTRWVNELLNKFSNQSLFGKDRNETLDTKMALLAGQLAGIDNRNKQHLWQQAEKAGGAIGTAFDTIAEGMIQPIKKIIYSDRLKNSKNKAVKTVVSTLKASPNVEVLIEQLQTVRDASGAIEQGFVMKLLNEIRGQHADNTVYHDLSRRAQNFVDRIRMKVKTQMAAFVRRSYLSELDQEKNEALSNMLKTDLDSLGIDNGEGVTYDSKLLTELYTDRNVRMKEIKKTMKAINKEFGKHGNQAHYYKAMAKSLGHYMVTGRPIERVLIMNSKIIADMDETGVTPKGNIKNAEALIDKLATLHAIEFTEKSIRDKVGEVMTAEFAADKTNNGITNTLKLHRANKKLSKKELFKGSEKLFVKGYTKELFADNKSFTVAPASHEANLQKEGFTKHGKVPKDPRDPNQEPMYFYTSNINTSGRWISGIISMTGRRAKGTNITNVYAQQGDLEPSIEALVDRPVIKQRKKRELQSILKGNSVPLDFNESALVPTFNAAGEMVEFRYVMSEAVKNGALGKDNSLDTILGAMEANIYDKKNSAIINREVIQAARDNFVKNAKKKRKNNKGFVEGYIEVGPNAPLEEYRNIYRMLPEDFKQDIRTIWGGDSMYVKTEEAAFVFGEREVLLSNLKWKNPKDATDSIEWMFTQVNNAAAYVLNRKGVKFMESIWKEVIGMAKDAIVIKSGIVLLGNKISNIILLKTMGVSVKDIGKYHAEAFVGISDHKRDTEALEKLRLEIQADPQKAKSLAPKIAELQNSINVNPVTPLIDAGMFQHIVEDVDLLQEDSYQSRIGEWLDNNKVVQGISKRTPDAVKDVTKNLVMAHDTSIYKFMRDMTQASDFVARYTLHQHHMTKLKGKITPKQSIDLITKTFVNYTPPTHRWLQYANDMGLVMFTKFFLRIQGVILYLAKERPGALLASLAGQAMVGVDFSDISDSVIFGSGIGNRISNPFDIAEQIITAPFSINGVEEIIK